MSRYSFGYRLTNRDLKYETSMSPPHVMVEEIKSVDSAKDMSENMKQKVMKPIYSTMFDVKPHEIRSKKVHSKIYYTI